MIDPIRIQCRIDPLQVLLNKEGALPRESASRQVQRPARSLDAMLRSGVVLNLFRVLKKISSLARLTKNEGDGVNEDEGRKNGRDERKKGKREKMQNRRRTNAKTERIKRVPHGKREEEKEKKRK
jgi:hypothetical protein